MQEPRTRRPDRTVQILRAVLAVLGAGLILAGSWYAYAYATSPEPIRHPAPTHYHFRLQVITNGTPVNFAAAKFQESEGTVCTDALTKEPIHFHDQLDQFVHIHWNHMTGGLVLKNYGWNFIGGPDDTLGYRFDTPLRPARVPIYAAALPTPPSDAQFYVYTGNADSYQERRWSDFVREDLRDFFAGKPARSTASPRGIAPTALVSAVLSQLVPSALAHSGHDDGDDQLTQLNDVLGSVVIFAQKNRPTPAQIQDRFNHLVPLPESSCGG